MYPFLLLLYRKTVNSKPKQMDYFQAETVA